MPACTVGDLAAGSSAVVTVEVEVDLDASGVLVNEAEVSAAVEDGKKRLVALQDRVASLPAPKNAS